jgi:hypothetical protein
MLYRRVVGGAVADSGAYPTASSEVGYRGRTCSGEGPEGIHRRGSSMLAIPDHGDAGSLPVMVMGSGEAMAGIMFHWEPFLEGI